MSVLRLTLIQPEDSADLSERMDLHAIADSVDAIVDITHCSMEWADPEPTPDGWKIGWLFYFRNENQEECVRSMLEDMILDFPDVLSLSSN